MSKSTRSLFQVEMADDTVYEVWADQRDWAAAEGQNFPQTQYMTFVRYMVYNAMRRQRLYVRPWDKFNRDDAVLVDDITPAPVDVVEQDGEDEQRLDPGPTTRNGDAGYFSPSPAVSRSTGLGGF